VQSLISGILAVEEEKRIDEQRQVIDQGDVERAVVL